MRVFAQAISLVRQLALSMKTRSRGPLVAQISVGRLAQPCGTGLPPELKSPANVSCSEAFVAGRRGARLGLSRRRSRVRVPSLPFQKPYLSGFRLDTSTRGAATQCIWNGVGAPARALLSNPSVGKLA